MDETTQWGAQASACGGASVARCCARWRSTRRSRPSRVCSARWAGGGKRGSPTGRWTSPRRHREHAAAALDRERRMLLALETGPSAEALDAPSGAPCLRCGGGAYAVACPLCSPRGPMIAAGAPTPPPQLLLFELPPVAVLVPAEEVSHRPARPRPRVDAAPAPCSLCGYPAPSAGASAAPATASSPTEGWSSSRTYAAPRAPVALPPGLPDGLARDAPADRGPPPRRGVRGTHRAPRRRPLP